MRCSTFFAFFPSIRASTHLSASDQQTIKTSVFIEVLTFTGGQLINYFLNSYESSKGGHFLFCMTVYICVIVYE